MLYRETDGWYIPNGLYISGSGLDSFVSGANDICILTEEGAGWGGMGKLQLNLVYNVNLGNVTPAVDYNLINTGHDVSVDVGAAAAGMPVTFKITGVTPTITAVRPTDTNGIAKYHYNRTSVGIDQIYAFIDTNGNANHDTGEPRSENTATEYWVNIGAVQPPGPEFNEVGFNHEVSVNIGIPVAGIMVKFASDLPPTEPPPNTEGDILLGIDTTDGSGNASITYHSDIPRLDIIYAFIDVDGDDAWDAPITGVSPGEPRSVAGGSARKYWLANFVTGGGNMKGVDNKVAWNFAGNVGIIGNDIVGQFQIVDHRGKQAVDWHCDNDFIHLNFITSGTYLPSANNDIAVFSGEFSNNRGLPPVTLTIIIGAGEPGTHGDRICIFEGTSSSNPLPLEAYWIGGPRSVPPPPHEGVPINGGNFQVHDIQAY